MPGLSINDARMTKRYRGFLPKGAQIVNYSEKATGKDCDLCRHTPEKRDPKPGYEHVSEEMRLMRVKLPEGMTSKDVNLGRADFTVTGQLIELNVCKDSQECRQRAVVLTDDEGNRVWGDEVLETF